MCAEAVAIGRALTEKGDKGIDTIVAVRHPKPGEPGDIAVVSPCGTCRELIHDYDAEGTRDRAGRQGGADRCDHRRTAAE